MPTVSSEIELLDLIEVDEQIIEPCSETNCKTTARWVCTCKTCGAAWPLCDGHYQYSHALVEVGTWQAVCPTCRTWGFHLVDVFIVVRLRVS